VSSSTPSPRSNTAAAPIPEPVIISTCQSEKVSVTISAPKQPFDAGKTEYIGKSCTYAHRNHSEPAILATALHLIEKSTDTPCTCQVETNATVIITQNVVIRLLTGLNVLQS